MSDAAGAEPLPSPVFDAHTHLDAMAQRAGVEASAAFVTATTPTARASGSWRR